MIGIPCNGKLARMSRRPYSILAVKKLQDNAIEHQKGNHYREGHFPEDFPTLQTLLSLFQKVELLAAVKQDAINDLITSLVGYNHTPEAYPPCQGSLDSLTAVDIKETYRDSVFFVEPGLKIESHRRKAYIPLKIVSRGFQTTAPISSVIAVAIDQAGSAILLELHNQRGNHIVHLNQEERVKVINPIIQQNQVWIIKDPYMRVNDRGHYVIRVDHLSDAVRLKMGDKRIPSKWQLSHWTTGSCNDWKLLAFSKFSAGDFQSALECYEFARKRAPTAMELLHITLHQSMAYLVTDRPTAAHRTLQALRSINWPGKQQNPFLDANFFKVVRNIFTVQRNYEEVSKILRWCEIYGLYVLDKDVIAKYRANINKMLSLQVKGDYSDDALLKSALSANPCHLNYPDFLGRVYTNPREFPRVLRAKERISAGEVVMAEKALAFQSTLAYNKVLQNIEGCKPELFEFGGVGESLSAVVHQRILNHWPVASGVMDLSVAYAGAYEESKTLDGIRVFDAFRVSKVIEVHAFGCPYNHNTASTVTKYKKIGKITLNNDDGYFCKGLWKQGAYLTSAADAKVEANVDVKFYGDMLLVRAVRDIGAPDQLVYE